MQFSFYIPKYSLLYVIWEAPCTIGGSNPQQIKLDVLGEELRHL